MRINEENDNPISHCKTSIVAMESSVYLDSNVDKDWAEQIKDIQIIQRALGNV